MHSAGSGAFKMRVYQPHQAIVLEANDSSPTGAPKLKSIIIKNVPDPASRRLLIQQGDADVARDLGADQIAALQGKPGVKVLSIPSAEQNYLVFNTGNSANPLLNNPAFWEARAGWSIMTASPKSAERPVFCSSELPAGRPAGGAGR
jgi:peptide/nickel transport system substrate-binding protein